MAAPPRREHPVVYNENLFAAFVQLGAGTGRLRAVFAFNDTVVFKVPRNSDGHYANQAALQLGEATLDQPRRDQHARCWAGTVAGVQVLFMERVTPLQASTQNWLPGIDNDQVGRAVDGELVVYDYGG